ncbi:hypothetical protein SOVF_214220 [Spinacia oleracea]|nr:hypothetical protein SOVF_214220 [Spinacia oleracea]
MSDEHNVEYFRDFSPSSVIEEVDDNLYQVDDNLYQVDDLEEEEEEEEDTLLLNEEIDEDDQASILDDVANYIKSLKLQIEVIHFLKTNNSSNKLM